MKAHLAILFLFIAVVATGQDLKGVWQGYITGEGLLNVSQYTLHVKSQTSNVVTGRAYLYSTELFIFQGAFDFVGRTDRDEVKITELKILNKSLPDDKFDLCTKFENLKYSLDSIQHLTGKWGNTRGNCPPGEIHLKKLATGHLQKNVPPEVYTRILEDKSPDITFLNTVLAGPIILDVHQIALEITLKDYLREDNDTVSVYFNRKEIIKDHKITNKAFSRKIKLDLLSGVNELVVYAKNLGTVPPNTCTLIVSDGINKQKVSITSDKQNSAAIYLNYNPSPRKDLSSI